LELLASKYDAAYEYLENVVLYIYTTNSQTPNAAVFGKLGRFPLAFICKQRALQFRIKISGKKHKIFYV